MVYSQEPGPLGGFCPGLGLGTPNIPPNSCTGKAYFQQTFIIISPTSSKMTQVFGLQIKGI